MCICSLTKWCQIFSKVTVSLRSHQQVWKLHCSVALHPWHHILILVILVPMEYCFIVISFWIFLFFKGIEQLQCFWTIYVSYSSCYCPVMILQLFFFLWEFCSNTFYKLLVCYMFQMPSPCLLLIFSFFFFQVFLMSIKKSFVRLSYSREKSMLDNWDNTKKAKQISIEREEAGHDHFVWTLSQGHA